MRELVVEALLRLIKPGIALVLGIVVWLVTTGPLGAAPSLELGLLAWLSGAAFVLLVESGPI